MEERPFSQIENHRVVKRIYGIFNGDEFVDEFGIFFNADQAYYCLYPYRDRLRKAKKDTYKVYLRKGQLEWY